MDTRSNETFIIVALSVVIVVLFVLMLIVFFVYFSPAPSHEIIVKNAGTLDVTVIFGAERNGALEYLPHHQLAPRSTFTYHANSGASVLIQAIPSTDIITDTGPFTTAAISFAGQGVQSNIQVTDGRVILPSLSGNSSTFDRYVVSVQRGYNMPVIITPLNEPSCTGTNWVNPITEADCPTGLQYATDHYEACATPCFSDPTSVTSCCATPDICDIHGACQQAWINDYLVFYQACPGCNISNCDHRDVICTPSSGTITNYEVTFFPDAIR